MIHFTEKARAKVRGFMEGTEAEGGLVLRIVVSGEGPDGYTYDFFLDERSNRREDDFVLEDKDFTTVVDAGTLKKMVGATVDWKETVNGSGFDVDNPNRPTPPPPPPDLDENDPVIRRIQEVLETRVNPGVASHGGVVSLIDVKDGKVFLKLGGGCQGCGLVDVTLKQGIEVMIKEAIPEISQVIDVTDHAGGTNPYYQPEK